MKTASEIRAEIQEALRKAEETTGQNFQELMGMVGTFSAEELLAMQDFAREEAEYSGKPELLKLGEIMRFALEQPVYLRHIVEGYQANQYVEQELTRDAAEEMLEDAMDLDGDYAMSPQERLSTSQHQKWASKENKKDRAALEKGGTEKIRKLPPKRER